MSTTTNTKRKRWTGGTLAEFVDYHGTQKAAAGIIGIHEGTVNRILNGHENPRGMTLDRLKQLRIHMGEKRKWEGGTLAQFLEHHGTQRAAAAAIGMREESLNRIIKGHNKNLSGRTLFRFSQLKISLGE